MEELFYIQDSRQYVGNCMLWWGAKSRGYTCNLDLAGKYSRQEAEEICANRESEKMWPVAEIDALASRHVDMQNVRRAKKQ